MVVLTSINWISRYDHEDLFLFVRFDDDFPGAIVPLRLNCPATFLMVGVKTGSVVQHLPQIGFAKASIDHPLEQMRGKFQFPRPPIWPFGHDGVSCTTS